MLSRCRVSFYIIPVEDAGALGWPVFRAFIGFNPALHTDLRTIWFIWSIIIWNGNVFL
jgi:hypothetical protein